MRLAVALLLALAPYAEAARLVAPKLRLAPAVRVSLAAPAPVLPVLRPVPLAPPVAVPWAAATPQQAAVFETRFAELHAAFESKPVELPEVEGGTPALLPPSSAEGGGGGQEPPDPPRNSGSGRSWFGFAKPAAFLLVALGVAQIGAETQAAAMPPLIAKIFGDVTISADLGVAAALADIAGTMVAPAVIKRLGLKKAYVASTTARLTVVGALAGMLAAGWITIPALMAVYAVENFLLGISYTAEKSIPAVMLDQDQSKLERFRAGRQVLVEIVASIVPIATGAAVASVGFVPVLVAFPISAAVSIGIVAMTLRLPQKLKAISELELPKGGFVRSLGRGVAVVARTPALAWSLAGYGFYYLMNPLLYWLLAPAFGLWVAGSETGGAFVSGILASAFSLGGLLMGLGMMRKQPKDLRRSMLRWMDVATISLAGLALFALGSPWLAAAALLVFGAAHVAAKIKLESFLQARAPRESIDDVTAAMEIFSSLLTAASLYALTFLFEGTPGQTAFSGFALLMLPLGLTFYLLRRGLARTSRDP